MKEISLYNFATSEDVTRRIQETLVHLFDGFGPVLDVGCGRGNFLEVLSKAGIEGVGVDHSEESIQFCEKKGFCVERAGAQDYLRRNKGRFGGIFCSHVIEHMTYDDASRFLDLCSGALRKGGILLVVTPNPADLSVISEIFWLDPTHVRPYPTQLLRAMLEAANFAVTLEKHFLGSWRMIGRRNLPAYWLRRIVLGRYYGKPNTLILGKKLQESV